MHFLLFVTFRRGHADTSKAARVYCAQALARRPAFVGEADRAICDWFVVGGRFSGAIPARSGCRPLDRVLAAARALRDAMLGRDAARALGDPDDAAIATAEVYRTLLQPHAGRPVFLDLDGDAVSPAVVGTKWVVAVDCHR